MAWLSRLLGTLRSGKVEQRIEEEVALHLELRTKALLDAGVPQEEARAQVLRRFGNRTKAREETRDTDVIGWLDGLLRDLRYSVRSLLHSKGYAVTALLILTLAIGANTSIFSILYGSLFEPFSFPDVHQIVVLQSKNAKGETGLLSCPDMDDLARQSQSFSSLTVWFSQTANLTGEGEPDRVRASYSDANFFRTFGIVPVRGRDFTDADHAVGAPRVVLIGYGLWQSRYAGADSVVGRKILLNNEPYTVAGILPNGFEFPFDREAGVWLPMATRSDHASRANSRTTQCGLAFGRMKPGVKREQAQAEASTIAASLSQQYPATNRDRGIEVAGLVEYWGRNARTSLFTMMAAVGLVMLIGCANLANLALSRTIAREREIAVRAALGAGRSDLLRHLFSETLMLCALGCALSVGLGYGGTRFLIAAGYADPQSYLRWQIVAFSAVLALLAALLVSAAPSHRILRGRLLTLREGDRGASAGPGRNSLRRAAMILQVAMSLVLLAGAGLLLESFRRVSRIDPGFAPENLLTMEYRMPPNKYPKPEQQVQFHRLVAERVRAVPGVASATVVMALPFSGNGEQVNFVLLDRGAPERGKEPLAELNRADESYFETMKIPLRQGRVVGAYDTLDAPAVVIINEGMAHRWWPGESPIGRKLRLVRRGDAPPLTVVGVVGDTRHGSLESPQADQIYVSFMQAPNIFGTLVARTAGEPMAMTAAVRGAVWSVDKDQPVWKIRTQESLIGRSFSQRRFLAALLAGFSGLALLLTAVGMYGVIRYWVEQRTRELGIRMAMGARPRDIVRMVSGQGIRVVAAGLALGIPATLALGSLIDSLLFGVRSNDPVTLTAVSLVLAAVALAAAILPARKAAHGDPLVALRADG